jgi:hypothetical protein
LDRLVDIEDNFRARWVSAVDEEWLIAEVQRLRLENARLARMADFLISELGRARLTGEAPDSGGGAEVHEVLSRDKPAS